MRQRPRASEVSVNHVLPRRSTLTGLLVIEGLRPAKHHENHSEVVYIGSEWRCRISNGTGLETDAPETGRRKPDVGNAASGAGTIEPRAAGAEKDFPDAERLVKRLVANELTLSFVPAAEQRLWRTVMRGKYQLTRNRVQLQNRLEALLEEAHIKLSSLVSDLLGARARRRLKELADG